jgi:aspartyl/glutamyl-tRNA(Asn/Gln) amidotransferase C subunit
MDVDIKALAKLARLELSAEETVKLEKEIPDILKFVETIQSADVPEEVKAPELRNVVRADENPHETGIYTERLVEAAPAHEGNRVVVKQVVSRKDKK